VRGAVRAAAAVYACGTRARACGARRTAARPDSSGVRVRARAAGAQRVNARAAQQCHARPPWRLPRRCCWRTRYGTPRCYRSMLLTRLPLQERTSPGL